MTEAEIRTAQLASATGIDVSTILTLLRGDGLPHIETLVLLADYFRCSTDYLLGLSTETTLVLDGLNEQEKKILYSMVDYFNQKRD